MTLVTACSYRHGKRRSPLDPLSVTRRRPPVRRHCAEIRARGARKDHDTRYCRDPHRTPALQGWRADPATVQLAYDQIDFSAASTVFKGSRHVGVCHLSRLEEAGVKANGGIGITEQYDAARLFLTPNTTTIYVLMCVNLKDGRWSCGCRAGAWSG